MAENKPVLCSERLPEVGERALFFDGEEWFIGAIHAGGNVVPDEAGFGVPTGSHWMPLPPPPTAKVDIL